MRHRPHIVHIIALAAIAAAIVMLQTGCALLFDHSAPVVSGAIQFTSVSSTSVTLSWTAAQDNYTSATDLKYQVYMSTDPSQIATLDDIGTRSSVTPVSGWLTGVDSGVTVSNLTAGTVYYFNVVVQDSAHNMAAYGTASFLAGSSATILQGDLPEDSSYNFSLNIGSTSKHVYLIFTNTGTTTQSYPAIAGFSYAGSKDVQGSTAAARSSESYSDVPQKVSDFLRHPARLSKGGYRSVTAPAPTTPQADVVGTTTRTFYDESDTLHTAVLAAENVNTYSADPRTVKVWVNQSEYPSAVSQAEAQAVADKFLQAGSTDTSDIYHWETNIYGAPWGSAPYSNLIPDNRVINIFFYNMGGSTSGYVVGFFYARDNYYQTSGTGTSTDYSNQAIMFYMNTYTYTGGGGADTVYSTLSHEFQHMIHFYQKTILLAGGSGTDTWLNEMMSMMTEDILSDKIQVAGPRGVDPTVYTSGSAGAALNTSGRLPLYDYYNDVSLTNWGGYDVLTSYSDAYAFGAYLERNFGGAGLLHDMMHNKYTNSEALMSALKSRGYTLSFGALLSQWAAAVLLSQFTTPPKYLQYNSGGWFTSNYGSFSYELGSINMFNYSLTSPVQNGPYLYTTSPIGFQGYQPAASNQFVDLGTKSGTINETFSVGADNRLTVIIE